MATRRFRKKKHHLHIFEFNEPANCEEFAVIMTRAERVEFSRTWIIENFETFFDSDLQRVRFLKNKNQQVNWSAGSKLVSRNFGAFDLTFLFFFYENLDYRDDEAVNNKEQVFFQSQSCFAHASSAARALRSKRISYRSTNLLDHSSTPAPSFSQCVVIEASIVGPQFLFVCALLCVRALSILSFFDRPRIMPVAELRTT